MRMWMVPTEFLCRRHLLGEHNECHMLVGCLLKGKSLEGFLNQGLVEPQSVHERHDALVKEMLKRGYHHDSYLPNRLHMPHTPHGCVDTLTSIQDLMSRCIQCRERIIFEVGTGQETRRFISPETTALILKEKHRVLKLQNTRHRRNAKTSFGNV